MIGDHYRDRWQDRPWWPGIVPPVWPSPPQPVYPIIQPPQTVVFTPVPEISRKEFDDLKREVTEMKELLKRAKKYDEDSGQRDCEIDEKMDLLRKVAKLVGVSLDDVIKPASAK